MKDENKRKWCRDKEITTMKVLYKINFFMSRIQVEHFVIFYFSLLTDIKIIYLHSGPLYKPSNFFEKSTFEVKTLVHHIF